MANTQAIQRRIKSVKSTKQITKAMELVAASKMRRAQEATLRSRAYANTAREILTRLSELTDVSAHPLFAVRPVKSRLHIVITSDRGLAGAYNSNILKQLTVDLKQDMESGVTSQVVAIGKIGARFVSRLEGVSVIGVYEKFPDRPSANEIRPIVDTAMNEFQGGGVDEVKVTFTDFKSSIVQEVASNVVLPASFVPIVDGKQVENEDAVFEPSPEAVLDTITPRLVEVQLFQAIKESQASEHSMRMLAMKSATDNASDLIDDLTLEFNSARQAAITQEIAEISSGAEALVA